MICSSLACSLGEKEDPLPQPLLRKYIAYARRYVHPKLGDASKKVHNDFVANNRVSPNARKR